MPPEKTPPRTLRKSAASAKPAAAPRGTPTRSLGANKPAASAKPAKVRAAKPAARPAKPARSVPSGEPRAKLTTAVVGQRAAYFISHVFGGQSMLFNLILGAMFVLVSYGLLMVLSASSIDSIKQYGDPMGMFWRQCVSATVGLAGLMIASTRSVEFYFRANRILFFGALALQLAVYIPGIGVNVNGNKEWIRLPGGFTIQPSEFIKLALIISIATLLTIREDEVYEAKRFTLPPLVQAFIAIVLIMVGKDLGTSLVIALIAIAMVWLAGAPGQHLKWPLIVGGVAVVGLLVSSPSRWGRIQAWLNPATSDQANPYAWQSQHGIWALANSHIIGQGLGMSTLKWSWIPEVENDYIFAIIGEELGFIGALATIAIFLLLGFWIVRVGLRAQDSFGRLVCFGVAAWIVLQAMVNIAVVLQLLPVLGVPLPLISDGGSSLIAGMAAIGVVLSIERHNHEVLDGAGRRPLRPVR
jgi:cell division protein FtsW